MMDEKFWVEYFANKSSFQWTFSVPITAKDWKCKVLEIDNEFLIKGKKYGLFYFEEDISEDYQEVRNKRFFNKESYYVELLGFQHYFDKEEEKHIGDMLIDIPKYTTEGIVNQPKIIHRHWPYHNLRVLEINNVPGLYLKDIEDLTFGFEEVIDFCLISSSNIWWEELLYGESKEGEIYKFDIPKNNRPSSYRITPRLNSFLRDLKIKTKDLGGSILLEEYDKRYVTEEGILLDGNIVYQEDIDEGRIDLSIIDNLPV